MTLTRWLWLGPVAFLVHDAEEWLTLGPWLAANGARLPAGAQRVFAPVTPQGFALGVLVLLAGFVAVTAHGVQRARAGRRAWPWLVVAGAFVANGLTHAAQALVLRGYVPGLVTALGVSVPYGWAAARAYRRAGLASWRQLALAGAAGLLLQAPLALAALLAGRALAGR